MPKAPWAILDVRVYPTCGYFLGVKVNDTTPICTYLVLVQDDLLLLLGELGYQRSWCNWQLFGEDGLKADGLIISLHSWLVAIHGSILG